MANYYGFLSAYRNQKYKYQYKIQEHLIKFKHTGYASAMSVVLFHYYYVHYCLDVYKEW